MDYVVEGAYVNDSALEGQGFLQPNTSWFRKHFSLVETESAAWANRSVWVTFDGVYRASDVFLNGVFVGHFESGFTSFRYYLHNVTDATGALALRYGPNATNVLAVFVDARVFEGWWYLGGGIYRHTWLESAPASFIVPWATYAPAFIPGTVPIVRSNGSDGGAAFETASSAVINYQTDVCLDASGGLGGVLPLNATLAVSVLVLDATGAVAGNATTPPFSLNASAADGTFGWTRVRANFALNGSAGAGGVVQLWSVDRPYLYTVQTTLLLLLQPGGSDWVAVDAENVTIGVRRMTFDSVAGFSLNGVPMRIRGACNHQDFAGCGVALPDRVQGFRIASLKSIGMNAWRCGGGGRGGGEAGDGRLSAALEAAQLFPLLHWHRTSHNPVNPELMDAFDTQGSELPPSLPSVRPAPGETRRPPTPCFPPSPVLALVELRNFANTTDYVQNAVDMVLRDRACRGSAGMQTHSLSP